MGFKLTALVVIGAGCTDSCKSDYYAITTMMVLIVFVSLQKLVHFNNKAN
jgi:hypothetical protein